MKRPPEPVARHSSWRTFVAVEGRERTFDRGEVIVPPRNEPRHLGLLLRGVAKLVGYGGEGKERILHLYLPDDLICGTAILEHRIWPYPILAMRNTRVALVERRSLLEVCGKDAELRIDLMRSISGSLSLEIAETMEAKSGSVHDRVRAFLQRLVVRHWRSDTFVRLPFKPTQPEIAQVVGASRTRICRALSDLEDRGALRRESRGWVVHPCRLETPPS